MDLGEVVESFSCELLYLPCDLESQSFFQAFCCKRRRSRHSSETGKRVIKTFQACKVAIKLTPGWTILVRGQNHRSFEPSGVNSRNSWPNSTAEASLFWTVFEWHTRRVSFPCTFNTTVCGSFMHQRPLDSLVSWILLGCLQNILKTDLFQD